MATQRTLRTIFAGALTTGLLATAFVVPASADVPRNCQYHVSQTGTTATACADADFDVITRPGYVGASTEGDASTNVGVQDGYGGEIISNPGVRDPLSLGSYGTGRSVSVARTGADVNETSLGTDPVTFFYILGIPVQAYKYFLPQDDVTVYTAGHATTCDVGRTGPADSLVPGPASCSTTLPLSDLVDWGSGFKALGWSSSRILR